MANNIFKNTSGKSITVPTPTGGFVQVLPNKYVVSDYYSALGIPGLTAQADSVVVAASDLVFASSQFPTTFKFDVVTVSDVDFTLKEANCFVIHNSSSTNTLTLPNNAQEGQQVMVYSNGASTITVAAPSGFSLAGTATVLTTRTAVFTLYGTVWLRTSEDGTNTYAVAGGADTQVQFNDGGTTLAGNAKLVFNKSTGALGVTGPVTATQFKLSALNTAPANAGATGTLGEVRIDNAFIYVCVATDTWKKAAIATW